MVQNQPGVLQMIRAPFLSSILSPLLAGTLLAVAVNQSFSLLGFVLVMVMGIGLHAATNVYNDIYDTLQGTDRVNVHRNQFSGGSGILIRFPELQGKMFFLARFSLVIALLATIGLMFVIDRALWPFLWGLYLLSAFFSKYYTAAPFKLASRGFGEVSVLFAFGPMAVLVAAVSQGVGLHPAVLVAMPITGLSTLSILLLGQLIDLPADKETGKLGVAARAGTKATAYLFVLVQFLLISNVLVLGLGFMKSSWPVLISLVPYAAMLPSIAHLAIQYHDNEDELKKAAGKNVQLHLAFSILLTIGLGFCLLT
ncbi:MAG: prenyltransferase [Chlorobiales bacterium]|nr:prenyltransferase [Chlorobiales bacterium]